MAKVSRSSYPNPQNRVLETNMPKLGPAQPRPVCNRMLITQCMSTKCVSVEKAGKFDSN